MSAGVGWLTELAAALRAVRTDLVGVYLHGSAVLGGFRPASSDVEVLAVVEPCAVETQHRMGQVIEAVDGCPGTGLEMSVVTAETAAGLGECRFEVHVATWRANRGASSPNGRSI